MQKISRMGLWFSTIIILMIAALQGFSGHWVTFFLLWPGGPSFGQNVINILVGLSNYHIVEGFVVGIFSVLVLFFAFLFKSNILVRIFAIIGFILVVVTILGGYLYVTSKLQDRLALGQMADAFVGVFVAYFLQLIFMIKAPRFAQRQKKAT